MTQSPPSAKKPVRRVERFPGELALKDRALDISGEGFAIVDLRPPHQPLIYVNRGFERLTGFSAEEVLGTNCRMLQGPETDPETREEIRRAVRERRECLVEILNYRKDGTPFWNRLSLTPVRDENGDVTHYIGVQSDVSERRRAEEALREANEKLKIANERRQRSLEAAARIQQSLLPQTLPVLPGARFAFGFRPSDELAGDVLSIVPLGPRHAGVFVIDVSGHGVPAALLSVTLSHWLQPARGQSPLVVQDPSEPGRPWITPPAQVAERLNAQFPFDTRTAQYFTMLYGVLDAAERRFCFVSAGHPAPIHLPRAGAPRPLVASGLPIGLLPEAHYEEHVLDLAPGDRVLLYSDGISDAENAAGQDFGIEGLLRVSADTRQLPLADAVAALIHSVETWCAPGIHRDDLSLIGFEVATETQR